MHNHHLFLQKILDAIHPKGIPAARKEALNAFRQEVVMFIQQRFPLHHERLGEPRTMGSKEKGTDVAFSFDIDLFVPFKYGFKTDPKGMKNAVYQAINEKFHQPPVTKVRSQRVSVGIRRMVGGQELAIDVVPGMEQKLGAYEDGSDDEGKLFLVLYDKDANNTRTTNVRRHSRLIKERALHYRDIVRLLKAWRNKETSITLGSFALELLVYRAAVAKDAPTTGALDDLLRFVLQHNIPLLEANVSLQDIGADLLQGQLKI
jgi:hypothetical protein